MNMNGYFWTGCLICCIIGCAHAAIFDVALPSSTDNTQTAGNYEYSKSILTDSSIKLDKENSVQLYTNSTPDAICNKGLRHENNNTNSANTPPKSMQEKPISGDLIVKIDNLNNRLDEMNKTLMTEFKRINAKFDTLNNTSQQLVQNQNIQDANKKNNKKPYSLSQDMQKTFSESTTRDLKDIPTAIYHN